MPHRRAYRWLLTHLEDTQLVVIGAGYIGTSFTWFGEPTVSRALGLAWLPYVNEKFIGLLWLISGVVAITVGLTHAANKIIGHAALYFVPVMLSLVFTISWLIYLLPDDVYEAGSPTGYASAMSFAVWALFALFSAIIWGRYGTVINTAMRLFEPDSEVGE